MVSFIAQASPVGWREPWPQTLWMWWEHVWWTRESSSMANAPATKVPWTASYRHGRMKGFLLYIKGFGQIGWDLVLGILFSLWPMSSWRNWICDRSRLHETSSENAHFWNSEASCLSHCFSLLGPPQIGVWATGEGWVSSDRCALHRKLCTKRLMASTVTSRH